MFHDEMYLRISQFLYAIIPPKSSLAENIAANAIHRTEEDEASQICEFLPQLMRLDPIRVSAIAVFSTLSRRMEYWNAVYEFVSRVLI